MKRILPLLSAISLTARSGDVDTSMVKSQKAPLFLGQSAMERFGTITIDNQNNKLIIKH